MTRQQVRRPNTIAVDADVADIATNENSKESSDPDSETEDESVQVYDNNQEEYDEVVPEREDITLWDTEVVYAEDQGKRATRRRLLSARSYTSHVSAADRGGGGGMENSPQETT